MISRPEKYVSILLDDIKTMITNAVREHCRATYHGAEYTAAQKRLSDVMKEVDALQEEIVRVCVQVKDK